jgi:hypothetical protein
MVNRVGSRARPGRGRTPHPCGELRGHTMRVPRWLSSDFQSVSCVDSHDSTRATRIIHPENSRGATIRSFQTEGAGQAGLADEVLGFRRFAALHEPPHLTLSLGPTHVST